MVEARGSQLAAWNRDDFWRTVAAINSQIPVTARDFVNSWWDLVLAGGVSKIRDSLEARALVSGRERRLKRKLARIDEA